MRLIFSILLVLYGSGFVILEAFKLNEPNPPCASGMRSGFAGGEIGMLCGANPSGMGYIMAAILFFLAWRLYAGRR
jgi:hypothetical protein